ncbi:MAG: asparagine synthase C-terminal domain-containing protein [Myxococcota bacterium]
MTRRHISVALSGDGGDELFSGYTRYGLAERLWRYARMTPRRGRQHVADWTRRVSPQTWDRLFAPALGFLPERYRRRARGDSLHKLASILGAESSQELYRLMTTHWDAPERFVIDCPRLPVLTEHDAFHANLKNPRRQMMFVDLMTYLPDDILVKVDRASMGVGLEARVPLLDHRVIEFAARLPMQHLVAGRSATTPSQATFGAIRTTNFNGAAQDGLPQH